MNQDALQIGLAGVMPMVRASGLLVSLATFQQPRGATTEDPAGNLDDSGFPVPEWDDIAGLVDIACTAPPLSFSDSSIAATEMKGMQESMLNAPKHVLLDSRYATAEAGWKNGWRIVIDGLPYDLMGVESDSQFQMTRCYVRRLTA